MLTFLPREALGRVLHRWWLIALLVLAGGLLGLLIDQLQPAEYEAGFTVLATIDQTVAGELTQYEQDIMLEAVGGILYAPSTLEAVAQEAGAQGISITPVELRDHSTVERQLSTWRVRVRAKGVDTANQLTQIWFGLSGAELQRTYAKAAEGDGLARYLASLESCLASAVITPPSYGVCSQADLPGIQELIAETGAAFTEARLSARGISTSLILDPAQMDVALAQRVSMHRAELALAGAMIGLLTGFWLAQADLSRWTRNNRHG